MCIDTDIDEKALKSIVHWFGAFLTHFHSFSTPQKDSGQTVSSILSL
jgi:hypothetical protein